MRLHQILQLAREHIAAGPGNNHCAVMFTKRRIYAISNNIRNTKVGRYIVPSTHAESGCLEDGVASAKRVSILVIRINKLGQLVNSKPCHFCTRLMKQCNIHRIYYSNDSGEIECHKLRNFQSSHISFGFRKIAGI
jgi:hypothetical protein